MFSIRISFDTTALLSQGSAGMCLHQHHLPSIQKSRCMKRTLLRELSLVCWQPIILGNESKSNQEICTFKASSSVKLHLDDTCFWVLGRVSQMEVTVGHNTLVTAIWCSVSYQWCTRGVEKFNPLGKTGCRWGINTLLTCGYEWACNSTCAVLVLLKDY